MHWSNYFRLVTQIGIRYFLIAGIAFFFFYRIFRNQRKYRKLQPRIPKAMDYGREISYSLLTIAIFAAVPLFILNYPPIAARNTFYRGISEHGWIYFFVAFPIMFLMHDTYFYWCHRLMHTRILFKVVHLVHHRSTNPSPWAAYAFHPLEAVIEAGIFAVFLFTIPVHIFHILIFFLLMIIYNVYGHLGYELYPKGFHKHWLGKWINTSVSHNQHHQYFRGNYGLYFTFWDRIMHTLRPDYDLQYEKMVG